jgi:hypothetical protein
MAEIRWSVSGAAEGKYRIRPWPAWENYKDIILWPC